jgi:hypothetical protein
MMGRISALAGLHWLAFVAESSANKVESKQCPNGGTGRRARFRTWFSQGSGGSSPLSGTIRIKAEFAATFAPGSQSASRPVRFSPPLSGLPYSFRALGSLLVLLAAVCCTLRPGDPAMVWGPLKRNYGGMRARIRARHGVHRFSVQTLQTHRGSRVSDLRHVFVALRAC